MPHLAQDSTGRDVVLLHGWGMRSTVWVDVAEPMQRKFVIKTPSLPGYGGGDSCRPYTLDAVAERLATQAPRRCAVVGWSLGGLLALRWASLHPQQVSRVALIASTPKFAAGIDWPHGMACAVLEDFAAAFRDEPAQTLARFILLQAQGEDRARTVVRRLGAHAADPRTASRAALEGGLAILNDTDLRGRLEGVRQPVLIVHGERDAVVPLGAAEYLKANLPRARLVVLRGVAHAPLVAAPDAIAGSLTAFLDE